MSTKWQDLQKDFMEIVRRAGGPMKSSCGTIVVNSVYGDPYVQDGFTVVLGGYCIGDWTRSEKIGPYPTEGEAFIATLQKVQEAQVIVEKEIQDEEELEAER